jgi:hypothetical protein
VNSLLPLVVLAFAVAVVVVVALLRRGTGRPSAAGMGTSAPIALPYRKKDYLLTRGERAFYDALCTAMADRYHIFPKIRLVDLLWLPRSTTQRQAHLNRVMSKHVDFVLCNREAVAPILVVELDDASHEREDRQERDTFLDAALQAAGLPILHVPARPSYSPVDIAALVSERTAGNN